MIKDSYNNIQKSGWISNPDIYDKSNVQIVVLYASLIL